MFVISIKTSKRKIWTLSGITICIFLLFFAYVNANNNGAMYVMSSNNFSTKAVDNSSRLNFLSSFGWQASTEPIQISEITIPSQFNDTYQKYNEMQKEQGFNLEKYKGKVCKQFKYKILNYSDNSSEVVANLIVYKNKIIGGDVSSVELSGFMHGFQNPCASSANSAKVNWNPGPNVTKSNNITKTTYRQDINQNDISQSWHPID